GRPGPAAGYLVHGDGRVRDHWRAAAPARRPGQGDDPRLSRHSRGEEPAMPESTPEAPPRRTMRYQLDTGLVRLTTAQRAPRGQAARAAVPRTSHAVFEPTPDRPDPIALLEEQAATRRSEERRVGKEWRSRWTRAE